jgi:hypothetical protein
MNDVNMEIVETEEIVVVTEDGEALPDDQNAQETETCFLVPDLPASGVLSPAGGSPLLIQPQRALSPLNILSHSKIPRRRPPPRLHLPEEKFYFLSHHKELAFFKLLFLLV